MQEKYDLAQPPRTQKQRNQEKVADYLAILRTLLILHIQPTRSPNIDPHFSSL